MQKPPIPLLAKRLTEAVHPDRSGPDAFFMGYFRLSFQMFVSGFWTQMLMRLFW